ncbi:peptide ABC transporter permease [Pilimelia anulata]|uniref:Peptide ABC transporter permease n=1 Tax=Pilimelia anulata TaxID=53371 RepID=A0A8J3BHX5_9ACTN|nr:ABC transporter permease [Pilimelia anulata]GGK09663.1 peptide ABC transporter permease [Pilimelia anulata]
MGIGPDPSQSSGAVALAEPEPPAAPKIEGRSLGRIAWTRLKRDKFAMGGIIVIGVLVLIAALATPITSVIGGNPNESHRDLIDKLSQAPIGSFGGMSLDHPFGLEPQSGRDLFSRVVHGAQVSLLVAFASTLLSVLIGATLGVVAGFFGGWVDAVISRLMDAFLAFPLLVFAISLVGVVPDRAFGLSGLGLRLAMLIFVIGFFSWPYIGRIVRGQTLSLREREFVDAARSMGARGPYIIFKEMLPNLVAPILIYATLLIPTNILFEAALSFLGVGVPPPTPSWGGMLSDAVQYYTLPHFMLWPGLAIFVTVLAFNMFGDGLRDALDPKANR